MLENFRSLFFGSFFFLDSMEYALLFLNMKTKLYLHMI